MADSRLRRRAGGVTPGARILLTIGATLAASTLVLSGCASQEQLDPEDQRAIAQLTEIAPQDSDIDGETTSVECWKPSESMLDDETFRVICRVHYDQAGEDRYRDMICIGNIEDDPVTDHCYRWAYYTDMPEFEDEPGHVAV